MRRIASLALASLATACGPGTGTPDGGDVDGGGGGGLVFAFVAPALDQQLGGLYIDKLTVSMADLRAVGDAAPGDDRTYVARLAIELDSDARPELELRDAPPGRYSAFEFAIDRAADGEEAWTMRGEVDVGGAVEEFTIEDDATTPVSLALVGLDLGPGEAVAVTISIDAAAVVDGIDWSSVPVDDGRRTIEPGSPLLPAIRARLADAISVGDIATIE